MFLNGGLRSEHSLAAWLRAGFVHQCGPAALVCVQDVVLEVPELLGADVTNLLGLGLVHRLEIFSIEKQYL